MNAKAFKKFFGSRLRELRNSKGISLNDLSSILTIPSTTMNAWEREASMPPAWVIPHIARFFGVPEASLLHPQNKKQPAYLEDFTTRNPVEQIMIYAKLINLHPTAMEAIECILEKSFVRAAELLLRVAQSEGGKKK